MAAVTSPSMLKTQNSKAHNYIPIGPCDQNFIQINQVFLCETLLTHRHTDTHTHRQTHTHTYRHPRSFSLYRYDNNIFSLLKVTEYKKKMTSAASISDSTMSEDLASLKSQK